MSFLHKVKAFVVRCGAPAKFVAKCIIDATVPGSAAVMALIDKAIDCAHETAKDNLEALATFRRTCATCCNVAWTTTPTSVPGMPALSWRSGRRRNPSRRARRP